jgi:hypothetical protein
VDGADLYWSESRPREGGRHTVTRWRRDAIEERLAAPFSARSRVNEYGGGAFTVAGGVLYFSHHADNRLYRQREGEAPQPITPEASWRCADLTFDALRLRCASSPVSARNRPTALSPWMPGAAWSRLPPVMISTPRRR